MTTSDLCGCLSHGKNIDSHLVCVSSGSNTDIGCQSWILITGRVGNLKVKCEKISDNILTCLRLYMEVLRQNKLALIGCGISKSRKCKQNDFSLAFNIRY